MERPEITGRDLPMKVGDCVNYLVGKNGKTSWGFVQKICGANVRVDDKEHYKKSVLRQRHDVISILSVPPTPTSTPKPTPTPTPTATSHPISSIDSDSDSSTDYATDSETNSQSGGYYDWWVYKEFQQPNVDLKSTKTIKYIADEKVELWKGHQYSIAMPTDSGRIIAPSETSGRVCIWLVDKNSRGETMRGKDVLYLSMHPSKYKQFAEEFPTFTVW